MGVTQKEALASLEAINNVNQHMRKSIAGGAAPYYLLLWGIVWIVGFTADQFLPQTIAGWIWIGMGIMIGILSGLLVARFHAKVRSPLSKRISLLWCAIFAFGLLWIWITQPLEANQVSIMVVTIVMFGYVIMGILFGGILKWVGLGVTALALIGYYFLQDWYSLWMAFIGGGTLFISGLVLLRQRRPESGNELSA